MRSVSPSPRQLVGLHAGRLELRLSRGEEPAAAGQRAVAQLAARFDGGVVLDLLSAPSATSLTVDGKTGELRLPAGVQLSGSGEGTPTAPGRRPTGDGT